MLQDSRHASGDTASCLDGNSLSGDGVRSRIIAVDAFRGFSLVGMILAHCHFVSDVRYSIFTMTDWIGLGFVDLMYPSFVFILGVSVVLSCSRKSEDCWQPKRMLVQAVLRSIKLFVLGLGVNVVILAALNAKGIRVMGTLQRLAIVYLACVILYVSSRWKTQLLIGVLVLLSYWLAMMLVPVPSVGVGVLEPGRNLAAWIDSQILPGVYSSGTWEADGIASTPPAIASGIFGMLVGYVLISRLAIEEKVNRLFVGGFLLFSLGFFWSLFFPIIKHIWTSSFVLFTAGLASMILASCIWLIDIKALGKWSYILVVLGRHSLFTFVFHYLVLFACLFPIHGKSSLMSLSISTLTSSMPEKLARLLFSFGIVGVCFGVVLGLHWVKILIRGKK